MNRYQFAKMKFLNRQTASINVQYIVYYTYDATKNCTIVIMLGEAGELHFPGDQTQEIEDSFRFVK